MRRFVTNALKGIVTCGKGTCSRACHGCENVKKKNIQRRKSAGEQMRKEEKKKKEERSRRRMSSVPSTKSRMYY